MLIRKPGIALIVHSKQMSIRFDRFSSAAQHVGYSGPSSQWRPFRYSWPLKNRWTHRVFHHHYAMVIVEHKTPSSVMVRQHRMYCCPDCVEQNRISGLKKIEWFRSFTWLIVWAAALWLKNHLCAWQNLDDSTLRPAESLGNWMRNYRNWKYSIWIDFMNGCTLYVNSVRTPTRTWSIRVVEYAFPASTSPICRTKRLWWISTELL